MSTTTIPVKQSWRTENPKPTDPIARKKWVQDELQRIREEQGPKNFKAVIGQWPGDETDEEIEEWIREIS
jgi:hypothetical protein